MEAAVARSEAASLDELKLERSDPDAELVRLCNSGNIEAFGMLVQRHQRAVRALAFRMVAPDDVEDMTQEIFLQAYINLRRFRGDSSFKTWLHRIAVNLTLKKIGYAGRRRNINLEMDDEIAANTVRIPAELQPEQIVERAEVSAMIRSSVDKLPGKHRVVVVMRYYEDRSCEEIAEILGCSVGTVWSRLHYACKYLRQELRAVVDPDFR